MRLTVQHLIILIGMATIWYITTLINPTTDWRTHATLASATLFLLVLATEP
jgi:hypothetical protein